MRRTSALLSCTLALAGCSSSAIRTYSDPAMGVRTIGTIAVLPLQNAPFANGESIRVNREVAQTVSRANPGIVIVGPVEAVQKLNEHNLVDDYDRYLVTLAQSGIANAGILARIGDALGADALMQGAFLGFGRQNGYGYAGSRLAVRYSLVSTVDGTVLWETTAELRNEAGPFSAAPTLEDVLPEAIRSVLASMPKLPPLSARRRD
jgi:hypothetical protein